MSQLVSINDEIMRVEEAFEKLNGYGLDFKSECLFARQLILKNDYTMKAVQADPPALRAAILNLSAIGISLNPALAHAYLVPRSPKKGMPPAICLDISYKGLVKLATDAGSIEWAKAVLVYEGDDFKWRGPAEAPLHEVEDVFAADRIDASDPLKNMRGGYCLAKLTGGGFMVDVMSAGEIIEVKLSSKAQNGPWQGKWAGEMAKKTLVKRASKSWPQSSGRDRLDTAINVLNQHEGIEQAEPIDESVIEKYRNLVSQGDPIMFSHYLTTLEPAQQDTCFNSSPKGEASAFKKLVREIQGKAKSILDDYATQIAEHADSGDSGAIAELYAELNEMEREMVDARMTDITSRQIDALDLEDVA